MNDGENTERKRRRKERVPPRDFKMLSALERIEQVRRGYHFRTGPWRECDGTDSVLIEVHYSEDENMTAISELSPPECTCEEQGQQMTSIGVMHREDCKWLVHPQGGNMAVCSEEERVALLAMLGSNVEH